MGYFRRMSGLVLAGVLMVTGCTGTTVKPSMTQQDAARTYSAVAIGDIAASDELWHAYAIELRRELANQLVVARAFSQVLDPAPTPLPADVLLISGRLTEVDKGSTAARWIVGFGAGRAHMTGEFQLKDTTGAQIGAYSVRKTYSGGAGIGGANLLDMDDLAKKLGAAAADSLAGWAKTGKFAEK